MSALAVAAVQHDIVWEDRDATLARVEPLVRDAADAGARLVLLPEMFAVGFTMGTDVVQEPTGGPTSAWLQAQAASHDVWIGGSVPERVPGHDRPANTFVLAAPDGAVHRYAKRHPFSFAGEDQHYEPGDELVTVAIGDVRASLAVCYDLRFADQFWQQAPHTDAYLVVANWPAARQAHWRSLLLARAIENQAYVVAVNRVGDAGPSGGGVHHAGGSLVIDPFGEIVAEADDREQLVTASLDPAVVADVRGRYPFLADRTRP